MAVTLVSSCSRTARACLSGLAAAAVMFGALSARAADTVLLHDDFSDNERTVGALPSGGKWVFVGSPGAVGLTADPRTAGQDLSFATDGATAAIALGFFTAPGAAQVLNEGGSIEFTFTARFDSLRALDAGFQFGLFNSTGATRPTGDTGSAFNSIYNSRYNGYLAQINPGAEAGGAFEIYRRNNIGTDYPFRGPSRLGATNPLPGSLGLSYQQAIPFSLKITRAGTGVTVVATVNGVVVSRTDTVATTTAFDTAGFCLNPLALGVNKSVVIDDAVVTYTEGAAVQTLLSDTFADSERLTQALPTSARWYYGGPGARLTAGPRPLYQHLYLTPGAADAAAVIHFTPANAPRTLAVGESLVVQATLAFENLRAVERGVRFGLFDSAGQQLADDTTDGLSPGPGGAFGAYRGYLVAANLAGTGGLNLYKRAAGSALFGDEVILGAEQTANLGLGLLLPARFSLLVSRTAAGLVLEASVNGRVVSRTDASPDTTRFDTLAVFGASDAFTRNAPLVIDEVLVLHRTGIPAVTTPSTIVSEPFTAPTWAAPTVDGAGAVVSAAYAAVGTIDNPGGVIASGGLLLEAQSVATGPWSAWLVTGSFPAANAETNLGLLTVAFDLQATAAKPVRVRIDSLDANDVVTGTRETVVYPAAANSWQRYAFELSDTALVGGNFDPTAPRQRFRFGIEGGVPGAWSDGAHSVKIDNLHYARPAFFVKPGVPVPSGPDAGRTEATAFPSIASAVNASVAGDIIVVGGSTGGVTVDYQLPSGINFSRVGVPAGWITLKNYPGQRPLIRSTESVTTFDNIGIGRGFAPYSLVPSPAYLEIRGLRLKGNKNELPVTDQGSTNGNSNTNGIAVNGRYNVNPPHHIRIAENEVYDFPAQGVGALVADYFYVENNEIHDNCNWTIYGTSGISSLRPWNFDGTSNTYRLQVIGNRSYRNETKKPWVAIGRISDGNGIIIDVASAPADPSGTIVDLNGRHGPFLGRTLVQNNVSFFNGGSGIHALVVNGIEVLNNTIYLNSASPALSYASLFGREVNDALYANNIIVSNSGKPLNTSAYTTLIPRTTGIVFRNNVYVPAAGITPYTEPTSTANVTTTDAGFVNAAATDFRLRSTSPAINLGFASSSAPSIDFLGYPRGTDGALDTGAFELQPIILGQPVSTTLLEGETLTLLVNALGDDLTFQWYYNGEAIAGATGATLEIPNAASANSGSYQVVVSANGNSVTSAASVVQVRVPATIITPPQSQTVVSGTSVTFTVVAAGDAPITYQWRKGGAPITDATGASYTLPIALTTDAGLYDVVVTNPVNSVTSAPATLIVNQAAAVVTLGALTANYDGSAHAVSVNTSPAGLAIDVTYDGSTTAPIYPGSYKVVATVDEPEYSGSATGTLVITISSIVGHAPELSGDVDGSLQVLLPESVTLNRGVLVAGDLLVPGTPTLVRNGGSTVLIETRDGPGAATPTNATVTLNGNATLRYLVRRIDALTMPTVNPPPLPTGTRDVTINNSSTSVGNFATLRNLTLNSGAGQIAVPAGTYGRFTVNGSSALILGIAGATEPSVYNLQNLTLNSSSSVLVVGPVVLNVATAVSFNGSAGNPEHPEWLTLNVAAGGVTLDGGVSLHGQVVAPNGSVTINRGTIHGSVISDRLAIYKDGLLHDPR